MFHVNSYAKGHKEIRAYKVHEADPTQVSYICHYFIVTASKH